MLTSYSRYFPQTRRKISEDESASPGYSLLERGGFIRPAVGAGIHSLLPLGWRVHRKVCDIIFDVMESHGVLNLTLPILQSKELWEKTGRWEAYVSSRTMFRTRDEHRGTEFGLAPTAEEMVTALVASDVKSWRELPLRLHQIGPKFRDEIRPRQGLLRGREFSMSDAYSFDRDEAGMRDSFELFREIYQEIFDRVGLETIAVQADSGAIGGQGSAEFMALNDVGEDTLLSCPKCGYGANAEKADSRYSATSPNGELRPARRVPTPNVRTVDELQAQFPSINASAMVKTLIFSVDGAEGEGDELVAVCIRGDLSVNEVKLANEVNQTIAPATSEAIRNATGAPVGFAGPIELKGVRSIYYDRSVEGMTNFLCGANEEDVHVLDVNFGPDVEPPERFYDLHLAKGGDECPECDGELVERRGIELGHVFMLQRGYTMALNAKFTNEEGREEAIWMGCYGIGTTRLVQAIAEQCRDDDGLIWPASVAPFDVHVILTKPGEPTQIKVLDQVAEALNAMGMTALVDDRDVSPGVKFKDADLLGCPLRLTVGRDAEDGQVELVERASRSLNMTPVADLADAITDVRSQMFATRT